MLKRDRPDGVERIRRRRALLSILLLPLAGCAGPWNVWSRGSIAADKTTATGTSTAPDIYEAEVIAGTVTEPIFRSASFRGAKDAVTQKSLLANSSPAVSESGAVGLDNTHASLKIAEVSPLSGHSESELRGGIIDVAAATEGLRAAALSTPVGLAAPVDWAAPSQLSGPAESDAAEPLADLVSGDLTDQSLPSPVIDTDAAMEESSQVIDLGAALGMAGGNAWVVQLARQRTVEAHADLLRARALWLPTLQFGVGWNKHDGRIQATPGQVIEASRASFFAGGGATLGAPIAGGSGGPFRLFADLALADAFFEPKIASRMLSARQAGVSVAKNQALRDAALAYVDLVEAAGQVADTQAAITSAGELLDLTRAFAQAGAGAQADVDRAATEQARLSQQSLDAGRRLRVNSATLARRLRLDARLPLLPADQVVVPLELTADTDLDALIAVATASRPEVIEQSYKIASLCMEVKKAQVDPWLPSVTMATSAGGFSGGKGSDLDNQGGRSDIDLQAIWELDSLGVGVSANRSRAASRLSQQRIELADLRDEITAQVVRAYENVMNYRAQIESAESAMQFAEASYQKNLSRVRADEGLPIELLQAITARAQGMRDRTAAVSNYNRAQLELLYSTGQL
jgi:outer membrane protein TolC